MFTPRVIQGLRTGLKYILIGVPFLYCAGIINNYTVLAEFKNIKKNMISKTILSFCKRFKILDLSQITISNGSMFVNLGPGHSYI